MFSAGTASRQQAVAHLDFQLFHLIPLSALIDMVWFVKAIQHATEPPIRALQRLGSGEDDITRGSVLHRPPTGMCHGGEEVCDRAATGSRNVRRIR